MITRRELAAQAGELSVSASFDTAVLDSEERLIGLRLKPRFGTRAWLPKGARPDWVSKAAREAEQVLPGQGAAPVAELLLHPLRIYELVTTPPLRALALVGSYRRAGSLDTYVGIGRLHLEQTGNKVRRSGPLEIVVVPIADAMSSRLALEELGRSLADGEVGNLKGGRTAVVVGGAQDVPITGVDRGRQSSLVVLWIPAAVCAPRALAS
jgi:hypothetical protein